MAQTLELLTHRTGTMRSIRGIVRTMKTMSAINALPYEQAAQAMAGYRSTVLDGLHAFVQRHGALPAETGRGLSPVVIAFGSDHGLCGNYNEIVAERADAARAAMPGARVICVGVQMEDALSGLGIRPEQVLLPPATADGLGRLAGRLIALLDAMRAPDGDLAVSLVFMQRAAHGQQEVAVQRLLPLDPAMTGAIAHRPWASRSLPYFSLPPDQLLAALIRSYLFAEMFRAAAEALVTENAARLARMQQAEQSIDEQLEELTGEMRSVRQSEITTELLDVIIGFEALKDRGRKKRGKPGAEEPSGE